ncbi:RnfH family protein [Comamonas composti]|uniref:RnfH family protein n=1 Tax=Comamonas composti TaxID=408558 RepID=UPI00047B9DA8|nr:RnfH family protein [Comamonas composti]
MAEGQGALQVTLARSPGPGQVEELQLQLPAGATLGDALQAAGWSHEGQAVGVWGRVGEPGQLLQPGDRVEIYRPLTVDPKEARRTRFARQGARTSGLFAKRRPNSKPGY